MELTKEEIEEKIKNGWIRAILWFEVLAVDKDVAINSLKDHIKKIGKDKHTFVIKERFEDVKEVEKPRENIEKGYSCAAEVEIITKNVESLLVNVVFFAPSSIEVIEPKEFNLNIQDIQTIMNSVADVLHRFASVSGGIIIKQNDKKD